MKKVDDRFMGEVKRDWGREDEQNKDNTVVKGVKGEVNKKCRRQMIKLRRMKGYAFQKNLL